MINKGGTVLTVKVTVTSVADLSIATSSSVVFDFPVIVPLRL